MTSEDHQKVIEHIHGPILVNAGPQTGIHTTSIKRLEHILKNVKGNYKILILTYNRLLAKQFKERILNEIQSDDKNILERFFVGTIHQFAKDIVETRGDVLGLKTKEIVLIDSSESENILKEILITRSNTNSPSQNLSQTNNVNIVREILYYISRQKRELKLPLPFEEHIDDDDKRFYDSIYYEYDLYLKARSLMDLDDLILLAYRIINEKPSINQIYQRIFKFAYIFEAQDLTYASYQFLQTLYPKHNSNIMLVGDKNQAIHSFTGASTSFMEQFETYYDPTIVKLKNNYRSSPEIASLIDKLISKSSFSSSSSKNGSVIIKELENEEKEAIWIAENISNLVKQGHSELNEKIHWDNIAVIARNRSSLRRIEKQFSEDNIPFINKTFGILESESTIMQVFESGFRLLINHNDRYHLDLFQSLIGVENKNSINYNSTENGIALLKHFESIVGKEWKNNYKALLDAWSYLWGPDMNFSDAILVLEKYFMSEKPVASVEETNVFMSDLKMWRDNWNMYIRDTNEYSLISFKNKFNSLSRTTGSGGVWLLTPSSSKGFEFDVVHVLGINEGVFPMNELTVEEDRQVLYVAISRARKLLYLSYIKSSSLKMGASYRQPSRFLKEMKLL
ncbi:ATP-dependent helicase [Paenibacillus sp. BGI2013]|uniref:ATP-dependent helicase n=1 Tax=Paenibacillus sp. BGI2013 TaxID=2058902 RepID=UPI0015D60453|nr:ATP-dependent helicase [Paenibacillus sp. BGI2013]